MNLSNRQNRILSLLTERKALSNQEIRQSLEKDFGSLTRMTIVRDLNDLIELQLVKKKVAGKYTTYSLTRQRVLFQPIDIETYYSKDFKDRNAKTSFNFEILNHLNNLFSSDEISKLEKLKRLYTKKIKKASLTIFKREFERFMIDFSWKSSQIEGNTYSLLETEALIKEKELAKGHDKKEAQMILNHKDALNYLLESKTKFKILKLRDIEDLHKILINGLDVTFGYRKISVGITGTLYKPLDNKYQIREALEKMIDVVNKTANVFEKALIAVLMISYIQPFEDGNKRTARIVANALLIAHDICPLSYRDIEAVEYKKAILLFYEQNNISYFKKLFIEQFEMAVREYF